MFAQLAMAAVAYARRGWRVIPLHHVREFSETPTCSCFRGKTGDCKAIGKHPTIKNWREVATTDVQLITAWWRAWPRANIGLLMGGVARLVTIDVDGDEGRESLSKFEAAHGALPETLTQLTGRTAGGEHRMFTVPPNLDINRIRNRAKLAPGIDIRAEGGLIVAAPSVHPSGNTYRWVDTAMPVAAMPPWVFKIATSQKARHQVVAGTERPDEATLERDGYPLSKRRVLARAKLINEAEPAIQGQNGSKACLHAACLLIRGYCLPPEEAFDMLWQVYNPICVPSWSEDELMHKIESAEYNVSDESYAWRYKIPAADLSPGGRMVEALHQQCAMELNEAARLQYGTPENSPDPTKGYTNTKKRKGAEDDETKCG